jgi:hypothetical protein
MILRDHRVRIDLGGFFAARSGAQAAYDLRWTVPRPMKRLPARLSRSLDILAAVVDEQQVFRAQPDGRSHPGEELDLGLPCSQSR